MLRKKIKKLTSGLMVGVVSATLISPSTTVFATEQKVTASEATSTLASEAISTSVQIEAKKRASVHDPSIIKDTINKEYYVFGSHIDAAKSTDLQNWTKFSNGYAPTENRIFGDLSSNLAGSFAWAGENDSDSKGGFSVWAPSVIWNETYINKDESKGAYMMYYCTSSTYKRSAIGYAVSKTIDGTYEYVDTIMYSGFTNVPNKEVVNDANSTINTQVKTLTDKDEIPVEINDKWFNTDGSYNTNYAPNAIDPELFYDGSGKLWMSYGSWAGGIYILEINQTTGKPIYPGKDGETDSTSNTNYTDRFFGKHIAGGFTQSGEGAEIVYDKANGYYYLYMTYAGLAADGGYNMRMFRSDSPTGPFVDAKGQNAAWSKTSNNNDYGIKLIGNYKFNCLDVGYKAAGHNSSFIDEDGKMYLIYHQRFDNGTEAHEVRVHQMFLNEDGWPVVAPYENSGDEISVTGYSKDDIVGDYQFINHGHTSDSAMLDTLSVKLNSDGTISGDITGTWNTIDGQYYMNAIIDGVTYKGVFFKQQDESKNVNKVMTFSAVGTNNEVIWGSKLELSDSDALNYVGNVLDGKIPSSTKIDLSLPTSGAYDTQISWSSSNTDILGNDGKVTRPQNKNEEITLTAKIIAKGGTTLEKEFTVLVKGELDFNGSPIYKYDFSTVSDKSIVNSGSKGTSSGASATLIGSTSTVVEDNTRGKVLEIKNTSKAIDANYLALPNNSFSGITENGFTVGMWVNVDTTDPNYFEHSALFEADKDGKNFPMTRIGANLLARINTGNDSFSDTDTAPLKSKTWQYLTYTVGATGIVVYLDGIEVGRQDKDITASLLDNILANINNIRVGSGSIWNDRDIALAKFDNIALYNTALTDQEVEGLYNKELAGDTEITVTDEQAVDFAAKELSDIIPGSTKTNLTLPTTGAYDTNIEWYSSEDSILKADGTIIRPKNDDKQVTLTAKVTKGNATSVKKTFQVTVLGVLTNFDIAPTHRYDFNASDTANSGSVSENATATLEGTASIVPDETRGNVLKIKNTGGTKVNYLALPENTFNGITDQGYTVSMWVNIDKSDTNYRENSALFEANGGGAGLYPMTRIGANLLTRINDGQGRWIDTSATDLLTTNTWEYVTYIVNPTGISVYVNGEQVNRFNKDISAAFQNNILAGMTDVRVGSGNIFNDQDLASAKFDNVAVFNTALTMQQVEALYNKELTSGDTGITVTDDQAVEFAADQLVDNIPSSTDENLILPSTGSYGATIEWSSSNTDILENDGTVTRFKNEDKEVTLTATITKGTSTTTKTFKITVLGVLTSFDVKPTYKYEFNTDSSRDISNSGSASGKATLQGAASIATDEDRGNVLQINNTDGVKENYLALPSSTFSGMTDKGFTVSMWVNVDISDPNYKPYSALFEANGGGQNQYPMTRISADLLTRINANGFIDTTPLNLLQSNTWEYVTYTVEPTGLSVYLNGKEVSRFNKDIANSFKDDILAGMTDVRVGSGNIWGDQDLASAKFDNVAVFNTALTMQQVEALYKQENKSSDSVEAAINSVVTTPASVTLTLGETKKLTAIVDAVGGADETVSWSSSDATDKVTVNNDGLVSVAEDAQLGDYEIKAISTVDSSKFGITIITVSGETEVPVDPEIPVDPEVPVDQETLSIIKQPSSQSVKKGKTVSFSIQVAGTAPFTYQWQKDEKDLNDGDSIIGSDEANLTIKGVRKTDAGQYSCIVTDGFGSVTTSSAVTLKVNSSSSSSSSNSSSNSSNSQSNTSTTNGTVTVNTNGLSIENTINAIKNALQNSTEKTIIITIPNSIQPSDSNAINILSQDVITTLKANLDKTLVLKINNSTIEIKCKDGQLQFTENNIPLTGFKTIGQTEYYLDTNGFMKIGWVQTPDSNWYYLDRGNGAKKLDWVKDTNGSWYYLDKTSGAMKTGWLKDTNNSWYYLDNLSGAMKTGWIKDEGKWYYLYSNGSLAVSDTIDGYVVNEKGEWI